MTPTNHGIDLTRLSRGELKQLTGDVAQELEAREHDDRLALEEKLRSLVEAAGFDPDGVRLAGTGKRRGRKAHQNNGGDNE